ncbi:MAG: 2-oxoglutarate ferredoxin oxidoreductase subunit gamma [Clostridiales bacterium]|jgi:2-oxoglutarate ferredoxin oxidoreductase subunit gamma|nr:2-oxoglutarate ferredoxin oxidoreductase subunit gamma [Clostridiales bacterium]MDN5283259.1 2-oxoglutarate ferredoxin oxidoreductase subunit gamma [Candidatus Ozemobacter sp.]
MSTKVERIILAGFGGQGILFLGKVLAETGMQAGKNVSWIPSYGPEMRGGTANCTVILSENEIASPMVTVPDTVIAMNRPSVAKFNLRIKAGGMLMYNSSLIERQEFRDDIRLVEIPASDIAEELGNPRVANLVMAGAYAKFSNLFTYEDLRETLPKLMPANKKDMVEINMAALEKGFNYVQEKKYMFGRYVYSVFKGI